MNRINTIIIILAAIIIGSGCMFSTSSTTINGVVMNYEKPVAGAEVTFGPTLGEVKTTTGPDGKFTVTAKHRATAMLYLKAEKKGYAQREKIDFPGFYPPEGEVKVEMLETIGYSK